jgi:hypothetical protein
VLVQTTPRLDPFSLLFAMPSFLRFPRALIVLAVLHVSLRCASATNTCYFPAGNIASSYVPCSPTGDGGCCVSGDMCTSLGYCVSNSKGYHYRGACTDSTWFNPSCPDYCLTNANCMVPKIQKMWTMTHADLRRSGE